MRVSRRRKLPLRLGLEQRVSLSPQGDTILTRRVVVGRAPCSLVDSDEANSPFIRADDPRCSGSNGPVLLPYAVSWSFAGGRCSESDSSDASGVPDEADGASGERLFLPEIRKGGSRGARPTVASSEVTTRRQTGRIDLGATVIDKSGRIVHRPPQPGPFRRCSACKSLFRLRLVREYDDTSGMKIRVFRCSKCGHKQEFAARLPPHTLGIADGGQNLGPSRRQGEEE